MFPLVPLPEFIRLWSPDLVTFHNYLPWIFIVVFFLMSLTAVLEAKQERELGEEKIRTYIEDAFMLLGIGFAGLVLGIYMLVLILLVAAIPLFKQAAFRVNEIGRIPIGVHKG